MFSRALSVGTRLNAWKTNPSLSRRSIVRSRSDMALTSSPSMKTCPDVTVSSPAMQCIRVDLPDPDGPMMAVNSPVSNDTSTPSRARTSAALLP